MRQPAARRLPLLLLLGDEAAEPRGGLERRLHGARDRGGAVDVAGQRRAEQMAAQVGAERVAVVLDEVVAHRRVPRLEARKLRVHLGKRQPDRAERHRLAVAHRHPVRGAALGRQEDARAVGEAVQLRRRLRRQRGKVELLAEQLDVDGGVEEADAHVHAPRVRLDQVVHHQADAARGRRLQHRRRRRRRPQPRADVPARADTQLQRDGAPRVALVQLDEQRLVAVPRERVERRRQRRRREAQRLQLAQHAEPRRQVDEHRVGAKVELDEATQVAERRRHLAQQVVPQPHVAQRVEPADRVRQPAEPVVVGLQRLEAAQRANRRRQLAQRVVVDAQLLQELELADARRQLLQLVAAEPQHLEPGQVAQLVGQPPQRVALELEDAERRREGADVRLKLLQPIV